MKPWPWPRVLAHRGGGSLAPENTLAAIRTGRHLGFTGIEFDAMLSSDGEPVLIHDETVDRTTDGRGRVAELTAGELQAFDAGAWFGRPFAGERIPRLEQAMALCAQLGVWMNAEIKPSAGADDITGSIVAQRLRPLAAQALPPLLSSFSERALVAARRAAPELPRGLLVGRIPGDWACRLGELDCVALHCDHRHLDRSMVDAVHHAGYWVFCYTVNEPSRAAELAVWGVDALCTDRLDRVGPEALSRG